MSNRDRRDRSADAMFKALAQHEAAAASGGRVRAGADVLQFSACSADRGPLGYYEMDKDLRLRRVENPAQDQWMQDHLAVPENGLLADDASAVYVDEAGNKWRLPFGGHASGTPDALGADRIAREVCTERDLLNCYGTLYELPAENAGGIAKVRPIATHNRRINDFCSWRGLLVVSGVSTKAPRRNPHIVRSEDGLCALWVGEVDDLWKLGKPRGEGAVWKDTPLAAGTTSDPYLMTGFDQKQLSLRHDTQTSAAFSVECDITGDGDWVVYDRFSVPAGKTLVHEFPQGFNAYWVRLTTETACTCTAKFIYR